MSMKRKHYVYKENYQKWNHLRITLCFLSVVYLVGEMMFFFFLYLSSFKYRVCFSDRVFSLGVSSSSYFQQLMFSITIHFLEASVFKRL